MVAPLAQGQERFDLTELATQEVVSDNSTRFKAWSATGLGLFIGALSVYAGLTRPVDLETYEISLPLAGLGVGMLVAGLKLPSYRHRFPAWVSITLEGMTFGPSTGSQMNSIDWGDPRIQLTLVDRRALVPRSALRHDPPTLYLYPGNGRYMPLPLPAFEAVIRLADRAGLSVDRSAVPGWPMRGTVSIIQIKAIRN